MPITPRTRLMVAQVLSIPCNGCLHSRGRAEPAEEAIHPSCTDVCRELFAASYARRLLTSVHSSHPVSQPYIRLTAFFTSCSLQAYAGVTGPVRLITLLPARLSTPS
ncbi:hypothetical protein LX36DRAFT_651989 [Colletotrichum falcatum]|nr:hypothetical protein LX36DRAFT_651989 [Colletotrichum falcatum]